MADGTQSGFDVDAARKAGYSDDEILQHLTSTRNFDVAGATKAGYSTQEIIQHLSTTAAPKQQAAQTASPQMERAMQQSFGGPPMFVDVPKGEGQKFEQAGKAGYAQGAKTGLEMVGSAAGAEAADVSSLPGVVRGIVRILGSGAGAGAGNVIGQAGGTGTVNPEETAKTAGTFAAYQTGGELLGAAGSLKNFIGKALFGPNGELSPLGKAVVHPTQLPELALRKVFQPEATEAAPATQTLAEKAKAGFEARKAAAGSSNIIVSPETPAPPINKTYVSYSAADLVQLARKGDLNAVRELIRNPRGIKLSDIPNVGYLMEPGRRGVVYGGPTGQ